MTSNFVNASSTQTLEESKAAAANARRIKRLTNSEAAALHEKMMELPEFKEIFAWFHRNITKKTIVLIDAANFQITAQALGIRIDYLRLRYLLDMICDLSRIYYFSAPPPRHAPTISQADLMVRNQLHWMQLNGYDIIERPRKEMVIRGADGKENRVILKANVDAELIVYALEYTRTADHIILFSGDGDFRFPVEVLQKRGQRVTAISSMKSPADTGSQVSMAAELLRQVDAFIDLMDIHPLISSVMESGAICDPKTFWTGQVAAEPPVIERDNLAPPPLNLQVHDIEIPAHPSFS